MLLAARLLLPLCLVHGAPQTARPRDAGAAVARDQVAARGGDRVLSFDEFDSILLLRHGASEAATAALTHLCNSGLLRVLAQERNVRIDERDIEARWQELDREIKQTGESGLHAYLKKSGVDTVEFRDHLRLGLVQERLAKQDLGIPPDRPISGEQQTNWLNGVLRERGLTRVEAPWKDGVVAHCAGLSIRVEEFVRELRKEVSADDVGNIAHQMLLERGILERMPDVPPESVERAVGDELARRRAETREDPRFKGLSYEQVLRAQGVDAERIELDPAIRVAALSRLWVDRKYPDEKLRERYESDRARYDGLFGEAIETHVLFLRAAEFENDLNPRSFAEAERELAALAERVRTRTEFQYEAQRRSEDRATREKEGFWGWITRGSGQIADSVKEAIFDALDSGRYDPAAPADDPQKRVVGPVRNKSGVVLLWLGDRRPAPTWDEMKENVHRDLRRAFLEEVLPKSSVRTFRDKQ